MKKNQVQRRKKGARHKADHDGSYKNLFSHPEMIEDLLKGFVEESWVEEADFTTLEKVSGSYVSDDLRDREDDIIWRVRLRERWLYVYVLLEFQSSIDPFMAVRIMVYVGLLYQDLIKSGRVRAGELLPPVLPLVLYNGEPRWNAALTVEDLIEEAPKGLERYRPRIEYLLLDEGTYSRSTLEPLRNLAAALFRMENSSDPGDIRLVVENLLAWLNAEQQASLRRAFTVWIRRVLMPARLPGVDLPEVQSLQEMRAMLAERVKSWTEEWKRQGMQEGLQQGLQQGKAEILKRQLEKRFGALPAPILDRVHKASASELDDWAEKLLDAGTLEEVFEFC